MLGLVDAGGALHHGGGGAAAAAAAAAADVGAGVAADADDDAPASKGHRPANVAPSVQQYHEQPERDQRSAEACR